MASGRCPSRDYRKYYLRYVSLSNTKISVVDWRLLPRFSVSLLRAPEKTKKLTISDSMSAVNLVVIVESMRTIITHNSADDTNALHVPSLIAVAAALGTQPFAPRSVRAHSKF